MTALSDRRLYDRWSRHPWALRFLYALVFLSRERRFRRRSLDALDLSPGDRVLELGCGPGNSLGPLRDRVEADGLVVGVDHSAGMVARARERTAEAGWANVAAVRADTASLPFAAETFDAAYAAMSLSAMPDPEAVLDAAAERLRPDGRVAVLDARPFQHGAWQLLNPVTTPLFERLTDWHPGVDVPGALARTFEEVSIRDATGGAVYVARGTVDG